MTISNTERSIKYRAKARDRINARRRQRYAENAEHRAQTLRESKAYREANAAKITARRRVRAHGTDGTSLIAEQGGRCAICWTAFSMLRSKYVHIDHDHRTGLVRGVLCAACNSGLGFFDDNPVVIDAAAAYLRRAR